MELEVCPECEVPIWFSSNHTWRGGGMVVESSDPDHRMVLIECDNLDPLFKEIEALIGIPIERIIIETKRRATRDYLNRIIPIEIREMVRSREIELVPLIEAVNVTGHLLGYGDSRLVKVVFENPEIDYVIERIKEPYSIALWCGDLSGSSESITGYDHDVSYEIIADDVIEIKAWPSPRPAGLASRLPVKEYKYVEGDIQLAKCPSCGGPATLSGYKWNTDRGVIEIQSSGRRVAMMGPAYLEAAFVELERELGEEIPKIVVEAQRRFTKQGLYSIEEIRQAEDFRKLLALRGLGNLIEMKMDDRGLRAQVQNAALHLLLAGLMQGYFEVLSRKESTVDWELKEDGTLELEITPTRP
ncbi:MAG: hypothetical protein A2W01_05560 [Candidatus Solincola sediminis]|uniref:Uncharacterized protein n=1 Tax=Candidatus Solincola sediminis TaxID=1797199 RepID=A0A1F2WGK4_9ACTN|nr:MAG: hypothetical protein A2Y75_04100 [Candidatus Solincola sediminis]OFW56208.1 MAG: hypothetical protein A2W01_05560 [Candidatus Solincola sediminis]